MAAATEAQNWASQAALNALLKYAPQKQGLAELQRAAEERFKESVAAGRSEGILGQQAARAAVAPTQQIFSSARQSGERGRALVAPILAALSADSPFKAAAANEQAAGTERLGQSESHALSDLQQRAVAASELPAFTRSAAMAELMKELTKISSKRSLLQGSEAADVQAEIGKQREEANKLAQAERASERSAETSRSNSERSSSTSRENNRETNRTRRETTGANKPLTHKEAEAARGLVAEIRHYAGEGGGSRAERVAALTEGRPEQSVKNAKGETVKVPKVPAFKPNVLMSAALDWAEYGHLARGTEARLRKAGYDPAALGVPRAPAPPKNLSQAAQRAAEAISL